MIKLFEKRRKRILEHKNFSVTVLSREESLQSIRNVIAECNSKISYFSRLKTCWWRRCLNRLNLFYPNYSNEEIEEWIVRWEKPLEFAKFVEKLNILSCYKVIKKLKSNEIQ